MHGQFAVADRGDDVAIESLGRALLAWEPRLDLYLPPVHARLFEPDGTLYAVALAPSHTISFNRRDRTLGLGDLIVVPRGMALDVEPEVHLLALRHDGPPPDHFRERFLQVWGFDHFPTPRGPSGEGAHDLIPRSDLRYRLSYSVADLAASAPASGPMASEVTLLIGLEGEGRVSLPDRRDPVPLPAARVMAIGPGLAYKVEGRGRLGRMILPTELAHEARRLGPEGDGPAVSPEFLPRRPPEAAPGRGPGMGTEAG